VSFVRLACVSYAHIKERLLSGFDDKFNKQLSAKSDRLLGPAITLQTAAGPAAGYPTRLASVRLGAIEMSDLGAVVSERMGEDSVLLGMNFLRRLEMVQRGEQMTLRPLGAGGG
jgi:hypothetical protein